MRRLLVLAAWLLLRASLQLPTVLLPSSCFVAAATEEGAGAAGGALQAGVALDAAPAAAAEPPETPLEADAAAVRPEGEGDAASDVGEGEGWSTEDSREEGGLDLVELMNTVRQQRTEARAAKKAVRPLAFLNGDMVLCLFVTALVLLYTLKTRCRLYTFDELTLKMSRQARWFSPRQAAYPSEDGHTYVVSLDFKGLERVVLPKRYTQSEKESLIALFERTLQHFEAVPPEETSACESSYILAAKDRQNWDFEFAQSEPRALQFWSQMHANALVGMSAHEAHKQTRACPPSASPFSKGDSQLQSSVFACCRRRQWQMPCGSA
ncbi:hypothetical protein Efla_002820 [Eimeria flavescens]